MNENANYHEGKVETPADPLQLKKISSQAEAILSQTVDTNRHLNSPESIAAVNKEVLSIKNNILRNIEAIDTLSPTLPTIDTFKDEVWELLTIPLAYGVDRAAIDYYGCVPALREIMRLYETKLSTLKMEALDGMQ
jgi:hypothetical protein